jgi:hypothetical protein
MPGSSESRGQGWILWMSCSFVSSGCPTIGISFCFQTPTGNSVNSCAESPPRHHPQLGDGLICSAKNVFTSYRFALSIVVLPENMCLSPSSGQDDVRFLAVRGDVERNPVRGRLVENGDEWERSTLWRWMQPTDPDPA